MKKIALLLLDLSGAFEFCRRLARRSLMVVTYHRVIGGSLTEQKMRPANSIYTEEFECQIKYLVRNCHIATGEEVRLFLTGEHSLPENSVFITFDDGYENNYTHAFPTLLKYRATAAFFLTTGLIGRGGARLWFDTLDRIVYRYNAEVWVNVLNDFGLPGTIKNGVSLRLWIKGLTQPKRDAVIEALVARLEPNPETGMEREVLEMMSWDQVRKMAAEGMTVGSHTLSHQILASASPEQVVEEITASRQIIEKETGKPCWCFAYPNGGVSDFTESDKAALRSAGYLCAFTQIPGFATSVTDRFALPRVPVPDSGDVRVYASRVTGFHYWMQRLSLSYQDHERAGM